MYCPIDVDQHLTNEVGLQTPYDLGGNMMAIDTATTTARKRAYFAMVIASDKTGQESWSIRLSCLNRR
jgi:hypothetical protein